MTAAACVECPHWSPSGGHGRCALIGCTVSAGTCRACLTGEVLISPGLTGPAEGLGDTVARTIHRATGGRVRPCSACHRLRRRLNRIIRYR